MADLLLFGKLLPLVLNALGLLLPLFAYEFGYLWVGKARMLGGEMALPGLSIKDECCREGKEPRTKVSQVLFLCCCLLRSCIFGLGVALFAFGLTPCVWNGGFEHSQSFVTYEVERNQDNKPGSHPLSCNTPPVKHKTGPLGQRATSSELSSRGFRKPKSQGVTADEL